MSARLPFEVVEQIIDYVAAFPEFPEYDDRLRNISSSIKVCALVCPSFLPLCRKHIFASVTLDELSSTSDDLNHLLSNSPHLAEYIRVLDYHVTDKEFIKKRFSWLLPMFKKLVKLQKLSISYSSCTRDAPNRLDWMSSSERKVLLPLLHLPTLTSIRLSKFSNFALADLAGCVNLKELEIYLLECSIGVGKFLEALPTTPVMLERLAINMWNVKPVQQLCHARRPDGKSIIDFSSLKELTAKVPRVDSIEDLFGICGNLHKVDLSSISLPDLISPSI